MIVTHLKHSYPNLVEDLRAGSAAGNSFRLEGLTRGQWPPMSTATATGYLDYLVGTWDDIIISAFLVNTIVVTPEGKTIFDYVPGNEEKPSDAFASMFSSNVAVDPAEWLVGCPIPGGPWKQGESRNTRRYDLEAYLDDYPHLVSRIDQDFGGRMASHLLDHFAGVRSVDLKDYPALSENESAVVTGGTDVTVVRQPGGTVVVTIPTGTRAQIMIEP
ncbi:hypothetical protein RCH16_003625 [Cryobacterium sp. MP_M5]|uniref:hypothetical protein n=1 Tax=unclassified Cryobacterium TaxID=2649013 RepID=UPI0018CA34D9|nr:MULTISPECIES: hypothetical protein [unclassified Cryobacterium]MBG6060150.1 hypothetical protein [Cryobacterium sp. MP_M3]MEC5178586.1 hypothetical protein [Cryobacterium sp. MP_M5]